MELPIRGEAEQAFLDVENLALYDLEGKNPHDKAKRLVGRIQELSTPDPLGRAGIVAVIDLDASGKPKSSESGLSLGYGYQLRADEKTKTELDGVTNSIKTTRAVPLDKPELRQAIDRSHPYIIEIGNQKTPFSLKHALMNQTNYNIALEPALTYAWNDINGRRSEPQPPKPDTIVAAVQMASQRAAERPRAPAMPPQ